MEKYSFFLFLVVILCVGCSSDEIESMNTDTDYVEYLMNKCDEFADKYKIPLKLENFADLVRWQLQKVDPHIGAVA